MKSIFNVLFMLLLFLPQLYAQDINLGEKPVLGEDKKKLGDELAVTKKSNNKDELADEIDFNLKEDKIELPSILAENVDPFTSADGKESGLKPKEIIHNDMMFGIGGFRRLDSFYYDIGYSKKDIEKDLLYKLHINRSIRGRDRRNSNLDSDLYAGSLQYKAVSLGLTHHIKDEELPGRKQALSYVNSSKYQSISVLNTDIMLIEDNNYDLSLSGELYARKVESSTEIRDYENNLYSSYLTYSSFLDMGSFNYLIKMKMGYFRDNIFPDKVSVGQALFQGRLRNKNIGSFAIDLKAGAEYAQTDSMGKKKDDTHGILGLSLLKGVGEKLNLGLSGEWGNMYKQGRDIYDAFEFDSDILPINTIRDILGWAPFSLKPDENVKTELSASFMLGGMLVGLKGRYLKSMNRIVYEELNWLLQDESPIRAFNYYKRLEWQEAEFHNSFSFLIFRSELKYIYSTLNNIPFTPNHSVFAHLIFNLGPFENRVIGKYFSSMYTQTGKINKINEFKNIDFSNSFKFNPTMKISAHVYNLMGWESRKKYKYPMDERKFVLEFNIQY